MCFSAQASFIAAGSLTALASITLYISKSHYERLLALTPLLFGIQQACEGIVWITIPNHTTTIWHTLGVYGFLFFAFIWWPIWLPYVIQKIEPNRHAKKIMRLMLIIGTLFSIILLGNLFFYGATATIAGHHVLYSLPVSMQLANLGLIVYSICVLTPFFISSTPGMPLLGTIVSITLAISFIFYRYYLVSIWCFFAALASLLIVALIMYHRRLRK